MPEDCEVGDDTTTRTGGQLVQCKMPPKLKPKSKNEKFKSSMELGGELAELLSICGMRLYEKRVALIKNLINSWKNGEEVALCVKGNYSIPLLLIISHCMTSS